MINPWMGKLRNIGLLLLALTGLYLYTFPAATIPYLVVVLGHVVAGFVVAGLLLPVLRRLRTFPAMIMVGWVSVGIGAVLGIVLTFTGATRPLIPLLYSHILFSGIGVTCLVARRARRLAFALPALVAISGAAWAEREIDWRNSHKIRNPALPPESQDYEGAGLRGDFFPSSAKTNLNNKID